MTEHERLIDLLETAKAAADQTGANEKESFDMMVSVCLVSIATSLAIFVDRAHPHTEEVAPGQEGVDWAELERLKRIRK